VINRSTAHGCVVRRAAVLTALLALLAVAAPSPARADDISIVAQVLPGSRTITTATLTPFSDVLRAASVTSTLAVTVTEAAVSGVDPWSVTARLCGPNGTGTAADCAADPDRLVLSTDTTQKITGTNLSLSARSVTPAGVTGTPTAVAGSEDLSTTRTIFSTAGELPASLYTGTYTSSSTVTLTPPAASTAGAYSGYLVITLVS
jgi:hypothetical protein